MPYGVAQDDGAGSPGDGLRIDPANNLGTRAGGVFGNEHHGETGSNGEMNRFFAPAQDSIQVPIFDGAASYERFDLGDDFGGEGRFEPPFLAASCETASG